MKAENPMVSAQTYINKGRALYQMGEADSSFFYVGKARQKCQSLPYNSGMVDVNLLHGALLTEQGGDHIYIGIEELEVVTKQATAINRAKAYHQLAQTYLNINESAKAEVMLDSMYMLLNQNATPTFIHIDYQPILHHYLGKKNHGKAEQYLTMMLHEQQSFKQKKLNYNLLENIVELQIEKKRQELEILHLTYANQRLWLLVGFVLALVSVSVIVVRLVKRGKRYQAQINSTNEKLSVLLDKLHKSNAEKEIRAQEIKEFLDNRDNHQELEAFTPTLLLTEGEIKFRQCFELLYPFFLPRLRERVPAITRREELFCMLIVLKQDNKRIAELMAIAPRSVLMLRHRFRQKIGMAVDNSLEDFIEDILKLPKNSANS
jgi:DNA-binding CsgD family transcriptional regulator